MPLFKSVFSKNNWSLSACWMIIIIVSFVPMVDKCQTNIQNIEILWCDCGMLSRGTSLSLSHVVEGRSRPETTLHSSGQPVPGVSGQVAVGCACILRTAVSVLQSVESHEGQLEKNTNMSIHRSTGVSLLFRETSSQLFADYSAILFREKWILFQFFYSYIFLTKKTKEETCFSKCADLLPIRILISFYSSPLSLI